MICVEEEIKNYLELAKIGRKQSYKNLALFPLLSTYSLVLDKRVIHLSVFSRPGDGKQDRGQSRMQSYSRRMRNRLY